jgi:riboflavin synthase
VTVFTGLVEILGTVEGIEPRDAGRRLWISGGAVVAELSVGDSLACDGCCLTVVESKDGRVALDAVHETLQRTTLGAWRAGDRVNLERALVLGARLGGHLVQGHVDGVGTVRRIEPEGESRRVTFDIPASLRRFVAEKGSLAVDGVSLTVAGLTDAGCTIAYIGHTLSVTSAGSYAVGRAVNLEVDLLARYLARLVEGSVVEGRPS